MEQLNIKEYFKTEKEKLRRVVIEHVYESPFSYDCRYY